MLLLANHEVRDLRSCAHCDQRAPCRGFAPLRLSPRRQRRTGGPWRYGHGLGLRPVASRVYYRGEPGQPFRRRCERCHPSAPPGDRGRSRTGIGRRRLFATGTAEPVRGPASCSLDTRHCIAVVADDVRGDVVQASVGSEARPARRSSTHDQPNDHSPLSSGATR